MARSVGIDLGTTNSCVAVLEGGEPTVIPNAEGARTTPSVVAFTNSGETLVGEVAKRQAVTNVDRTVRSVKRHMGETWTMGVDDKTYKPQQISAFILQKLKRDAEAYLGEPVTNAVITVPAYFSDAQRQATKEAGEIAGLTVDRIVNEPTAAALAYGLDKADKEQTVLVFDLGGGTFDVSLLDISDGVFEVKATNGDNHLGGDDWDQRIVDWLVTQFKNANGIDLAADKMAKQRLQEAAERAKIELSQASETHINLPYITAGAAGPLHLDEKLTRAEFQRMTSDLLERCRTPFNAVMKDAGLNVSQIDEVILVGGSTRMPAVAELGLTPFDVPGRQGELKHLIVTGSPDGELMARFVLRSPGQMGRVERGLDLLRKAAPGLRVVSVNLQPEYKAVLEGEEEVVLTPADTLPMRVGEIVFHLRPRSFFQTNTTVTTALYGQARDWVGLIDPGSVLDLYCGVGGFALNAALAPGRQQAVLLHTIGPCPPTT